jgi:hypothetical protein
MIHQTAKAIDMAFKAVRPFQVNADNQPRAFFGLLN